MTLQRTFAVASKEVMHILRDPQVLAFALGMPVLLLLLFGYAVSFDVEHIPLAVVDQDHSAESRTLARAFSASGLFDEVARTDVDGAAEPLFRRGVARAALVIPRGFAADSGAGREARAQLLLDGSDNTTAALALGYATSIALRASQARLDALVGAHGVEPPLEARARTLYNPALRSSVFLVPGLIVVILVMVAVMLTALTLAREYERGSMEQLFATPVTSAEVILGKLSPYFIIGLLQVLLVLVVGVTLFDVPVRGSLAVLYLVASVFLLAMLTQGLMLSAVTRNQMIASQAAALSTLLPSLLLSGFVFPIENMPPVLQGVAHVLPATYLVHALKAILLRGNGLAAVVPDILAMLAFFLVVLLVSVKRFRR